ncbi:NEL-type E3 ubiquitin ligase domain-containing protein [Pseudomonas trivialis]|uniref:NEL-type E3 ubiquitin ligase domain-containing protein n=1 Tax=Pseudomonas trivialis TaxID=200450 RepID=UPI0030D09455
MSEQLTPPVAEGVFNADTRGVHYDFLKDRVPTWFVQASTQRQEELANHELHQLPSWYLAASSDAKGVLAASQTIFRETLNTLENVLGSITDIVAFAEERLKKTIKHTFNLDLDVRSVYFARKYSYPQGRSDLYGAFAFERETDPSLNYFYRGISLLEAALANFEPDEEQPPPCNDCQIITTFGAYDGEVLPTFEALEDQALNIAPHAFAKLCRTLDLGGLYQQHLKTVLRSDVAVERFVVEQQMQAHYRDQLALSVEMAHMQFATVPDDNQVQSGISDTAYQMLKQVLTDTPGVTLDGRAVTFSVLKVFDIRLVGPLLISPDREDSDRVERVLVYLPNDPQQPLTEYASSADFMVDLRTRLHSASYRRFFSRFIPQREQGEFFKQFNRLYQPSDNGDATQDFPLQPRPARLRLNDASLRGNVWEQVSRAAINKIFIDARAVAVPTGDEDIKAREERLASYFDAVVSFLNVAAFWVPGLGPVMLAVGAAQMMSEVVEGIEALAQGEIREGWAHLSSVALNVALLAGGAKVVPHIKGFSALDPFKPVTMPTGKQLLWKADLGPYEAPVKLAPESKPDGLGLHQQGGRTMVAIEGKLYHVQQDPITAQYRIQHPTRPHAYTPKLEHDYRGTWSHELEEPLTWDEPTLHRRLGLAEYQDQVRISGVEPNVLRETFVDHDVLPHVLDETITRFQIHQQLTTFVEQMNSADPQVYAQADPGLQLDIMQRRGLLPETPPLRVLDNDARVLWETPGPASTETRVVALSQENMSGGELLKEVLYTLQGVDPTLAEIPGNPKDSLYRRADQLRTYVARTVDALKRPLMDERYRAVTRTSNPDVQRVLEGYPDLSTPMAAHMLESLDTGPLQVFRRTGRLPETLAEQLRWCEQETRVSRAYEGLHLDSLTDIDSQRLALRTLETLPGWRRGTRLELRLYSAQGAILDAIGSVDASLTRALVLQESGVFATQGQGDFYTAVWEALSPAERQAMEWSDAAQLKQAIQQSPLARADLRTVLLEHPVRKPAYDSSMRLFGGGPGFRQLLSRTTQVFRAPEARVRKLFPALSDAQVAEFIRSLGDDVSGGLARREAEFESLDRTLKGWVKANAPRVTTTQFDRAGGIAGHAANEIRRCWRRETGAKLRLPNGRGMTLPVVVGDFSHVEVLEISGFKSAGHTDALLQNFSQLKVLALRNCELTELPQALTAIKGLTSLDLESNPLRLTPQSVATLNTLGTLEVLSLLGCPLGTPLDFSGLPRLKRLNLSSTKIEQWPTGLQQLPVLEVLDLRNNRLRVVPQEILNPPPEQFEQIARINRVTLLEGNTFADDDWQLFDGYWKRLGETWPDLLLGALDGAFDSGNPRVRAVRKMYPAYDAQKAREFVWRLGDGAEVEIARLEREFDGLDAQLSAWTFSGGGAHQRYVRPNQRQVSAATHLGRYEAQQRIMRCWRRETPQKLANDGTPIGLELDLSRLDLPSLPDLDADFSHVGSLKLNNMNLASSPEGFLAQFRGVRWLDLSGNQLRVLPPALGEMPGLTRLFLQNNRIRLTAETARILSGRVTLRALMLSGNDLGIAPDFSQISDMRSLGLSNAGLETWPVGLAEQPLLDGINLSANHLTSIPASVISPPDAQLAQTARVNNVTDASNNPWSEATLQQVQAYGERLERAGLASAGRPNRLVATVARRASPGAPALESAAPFRRWATGLTEAQVPARKAQWDGLHGRAGAQGFFEMLSGLETSSAGHADLQRRVWEVIDAITAHSAESESLREQMFEWAGRAACCDRAALSFGNLEIMAMVYKARLQAMDANQGAALSTLSKRLFRLDQVEKIALNDIDQRRTAINHNPQLTPIQKESQLAALEEVEIRLAYRDGLKDRLDLPGAPAQARFTRLAEVTQAMLDAAYAKVMALDESVQAFQALLAREFWQDFITQKYRPYFEAQSKPYQDELAVLFEQNSDGRLSNHAFETKAQALQARLVIEDAALIDRLTRKEIVDHQAAVTGLEALIEPVAGRLALSQAQVIECDGAQYFIASMPDAGDGQHYLLRVQSPDNPFQLVSSGIVAKPDVAGVWKRRGLAGGGSDSEYEEASEAMPVAPYTAAELSFMRATAHFTTLKNELGRYNRANNGKYPLRDLQGRPIRIRSLQRQVTMHPDAIYASTPIKPYLQFEGYEHVGGLYEEKLQWRLFTADDVKVPGEQALIGQSMVVANRRIVKGEIVGLYGGTVIPYGMSVRSESTFGMIVGYELAPVVGSFRADPILIIGDNIISRVNTNFEYDVHGQPVRQAPEGYNVECVPFEVEAEHATSAAGKRTSYRLNTVFATQDIPAGTELRMDYGYTEAMIKNKFSGAAQ